MHSRLVVDYTGNTVGYAHEGDAGLDLAIVGDHTLSPWEKKLIPTGVSFALPVTTVGLLAPRSSSGKIDVVLANTIGIIDCTYRGEVKLFIRNLHPTNVLELKDGQCVAQLIIVPFITALLHKVDKLPESTRGLGGFGSTGERGREVDFPSEPLCSNCSCVALVCQCSARECSICGRTRNGCECVAFT